jgi:putative CocE/NonD family hydrolase
VSEGVWRAFSARENKDAGEVVEWAHAQPWSDGDVAMSGASYMGISQLFAAGHRPAGLKAIFPQVPAADVYRDVVASGGQIDVGFIPLWMGLVTGTGLVPPAYAAGAPDAGLKWLTDRLATATTFTAPLMANALLGGQPAYDSAFYRERSPIEVLDRIDVPTFLVGGQFDLFQRGTPMVFDRLQRRGVPVRMIFGPWDHLQGSSGAEVAAAGHGTLPELQLRWFDHWLKGRDGALDEIAPLTYYEQGSGDWVEQPEWIADDLSARSFRLSGRSTMLGNPGTLVDGTPTAARSQLVPLPVSGLCTRSANQWTAGILNTVWPDSPCLRDNALNDQTGLTFETAPMTEPLRFQGPLNARLHVSAPSGDGMLSVAVEDVAPDGTVTRVTGGWQVVSQREVDEARSRYLDGELIQPHHPFTKEARQPLRTGQIAPVDVEIFPTGAVIRPGHRLRLAIQGYDVPHLLAPLTTVLQQALPLTIHVGPQHPSELTVPVRE